MYAKMAHGHRHRGYKPHYIPCSSHWTASNNESGIRLSDRSPDLHIHPHRSGINGNREINLNRIDSLKDPRKIIYLLFLRYFARMS